MLFLLNTTRSSQSGVLRMGPGKVRDFWTELSRAKSSHDSTIPDNYLHVTAKEWTNERLNGLQSVYMCVSETLIMSALTSKGPPVHNAAVFPLSCMCPSEGPKE